MKKLWLDFLENTLYCYCAPSREFFKTHPQREPRSAGQPKEKLYFALPLRLCVFA